MPLVCIVIFWFTWFAQFQAFRRKRILGYWLSTLPSKHLGRVSSMPLTSTSQFDFSLTISELLLQWSSCFPKAIVILNVGIVRNRCTVVCLNLIEVLRVHEPFCLICWYIFEFQCPEPCRFSSSCVRQVRTTLNPIGTRKLEDCLWYIEVFPSNNKATTGSNTAPIWRNICLYELTEF